MIHKFGNFVPQVSCLFTFFILGAPITEPMNAEHHSISIQAGFTIFQG